MPGITRDTIAQRHKALLDKQVKGLREKGIKKTYILIPWTHYRSICYLENKQVKKYYGYDLRPLPRPANTATD